MFAHLIPDGVSINRSGSRGLDGAPRIVDQNSRIIGDRTLSASPYYERLTEPFRNVEAVSKDTVQDSLVVVVPYPFSAQTTSYPPMTPSYQLPEVT